MCGRFTLTVPDYATLARALGVDIDPAIAALYRPRYNTAPSNVCFVVQKQGDRRVVVPARWGIAARRAAGARAAAINVRAETARSSPAFRDAFARRRCVVAADGFFEWTGPKNRRKPIWFHATDGALVPLAGLYESWKDPRSGELETTFAILTTAPNELVAPVHDRMPAILPIHDIERWLDASEPPERADRLQALLRPADAKLLVATPASRRVGSVANDDPACLCEDAEQPPSGTLPLFGPQIAGR